MYCWLSLIRVVFVQRQKQPVNPDLKKKFQGIHSEKLFEEKLQKRREKVEQVTADCYILYLSVSWVFFCISVKRDIEVTMHSCFCFRDGYLMRLSVCLFIGCFRNL